MYCGTESSFPGTNSSTERDVNRVIIEPICLVAVEVTLGVVRLGVEPRLAGEGGRGGSARRWSDRA
jgi:hypothetical protein